VPLPLPDRISWLFALREHSCDRYELNWVSLGFSGTTLVAGQVPVATANPFSMCSLVSKSASQVPLLPKQELRELVERCWSEEPNKRPAFTEVVTILDGLQQKMPRTPYGVTASGGCCSVQ
jgi:Protein tyrosine and serine/threonine kinase